MATSPTDPSLPPTSRRNQRRAAREQQHLNALARESTSLVGPVILVVLGVIFLLVEVGHLSLAHLLGGSLRWSPLLLILLGLIRLAEWLWDRHHLRQAEQTGVPARTTRLGPGWVVLVGILILFSFGGRFALKHHADSSPFALFSDGHQNWDEFFGQRHESESTFSQPCPPGSSASINVGHGDLTITGSSTDDQIHASVHTTVFAGSDADASRKAEQLKPTITADGTQINISVPYSDDSQTDLVLSVPPTLVVNAHSDHGDINLSNLNASVSVLSNHGDVDLTNIQGNTQIRLNNSGSAINEHQIHGDTSISGRAQDLTVSDVTGALQLDGDVFGDMHLEHIGGPIRFHTSRVDLQVAGLRGSLATEDSGELTADQLSGPASINARNRNISLEDVSGPLTVINQNGSVAISTVSPLGVLNVSNRNGDVTLNLPEGDSFALSADTTDADINNDFGFSASQHGDRTELQGNVGSGGPPIRLHTTQGNIQINKGPRSSSVTPQAPPSSSAPASRHHRAQTPERTGGEVSF